MWGEYAKDPRMKANIGIRRRLAPLLDNDINQMELFTALLLSLPGSPVLYYGDEIGMGDNIWLGDRDGVRTPMQWTADRNAGFSVGHARQAAPAGRSRTRSSATRRVNVEAAAGELLLAAALDPADDPRPQAATRRSGSARSPTSAAPTRACCPTSASTSATTATTTSSSASTTCPASRSRSSSTCAAARAWSRSSCSAACRSRDRRAALPADPERLRLLLVPADQPGHRGGTAPRDRRRAARHRDRCSCATSSGARWFGGKGRPVRR